MQAHQQIIRDDEKKNTERIRWSELRKSGRMGEREAKVRCLRRPEPLVRTI